MTTSLENEKRKRLLEIAKEKGIVGRHKMQKANLIVEIRKALSKNVNGALDNDVLNIIGQNADSDTKQTLKLTNKFFKECIGSSCRDKTTYKYGRKNGELLIKLLTTNLPYNTVIAVNQKEYSEGTYLNFKLKTNDTYSKIMLFKYTKGTKTDIGSFKYNFDTDYKTVLEKLTISKIVHNKYFKYVSDLLYNMSYLHNQMPLQIEKPKLGCDHLRKQLQPTPNTILRDWDYNIRKHRKHHLQK